MDDGLNEQRAIIAANLARMDAEIRRDSGTMFWFKITYSYGRGNDRTTATTRTQARDQEDAKEDALRHLTQKHGGMIVIKSVAVET